MSPSPVFSGLDARTGQRLTGEAHLLASIRDILMTPRGSRVLRRTYGSGLPALIDAPAGPAMFAEIRAAVASALARWEPRLKLTRVQVSRAEAGRLDLTLEGMFEGRALTLSGLKLS